MLKDEDYGMNKHSKGSESAGFHLEHWHKMALLLFVYDMVIVNASYLAALLLRFDVRYSAIDKSYLSAFYNFAPIYTLFCAAVFMLLRLYKSIWRFASYNELMQTAKASLITFLFHTACITLLFRRMPISYYIIGAVLQFIFVLGARFIYRFVLLLRGRNPSSHSGDAPKIMIIGAGSSGQMLLRDIKMSSEISGSVRCFIDDNKNKHGRLIDGVPVVGNRDDIIEACKKYDIDKIYLAMPGAAARDKGEILNICKESGCELKSLPGLYQLAKGEVSVSKMRDVSVEDLLGREPIKVDMTQIREYLAGKTILITGGGGSIGSEIARQVATPSYGISALVLVDIYENGVYEVQQELKRNYPMLHLSVDIASVRDSRRIEQIFEKYKPDIVFHAAAHKHVPLMEDSPDEAIKNNVIGTYKTAYTAMMNGCQRFVLISTDKAVNPTNIMGASKRICEMIVQSFGKKIKENREIELPVLHMHPDDRPRRPFVIPGQDNIGHKSAQTEFVAVRFGNVLGSNGSVIPLFKKQIEAGGPVTVTHPDITRYFMTIPEAVSLVLQAGTYAKGGEIFVLDMGDPVKIDDLARNLILLSGYTPDEDISIEYTGLRPGEKLYEEKLMDEEGLRRTENDLIHIGDPIEFDCDAFLDSLHGLMEAAYENDEKIREKVAGIVDTYHPAVAQGQV